MEGLLKTLIHVADCGSFSGAAEKLFLSPTAVMKQMNQLEDLAGVPLLIRTNHGAALTDAGKSLYGDAKYLIQYVEEALTRARRAAGAAPYIIRVGNSLLNPCKGLIALWNRVSPGYPQFKIQIIPFEDDVRSLIQIYRTIGQKFDVMVGSYDQEGGARYFQTLELGRCRFCIAVPREHPLAEKGRLSLGDLRNERMMMVQTGTSAQNDRIRARLLEDCPGIGIIDAPRHYDLEVFNRCEREGLLLLTLDAWQDVHPALKTLPVDWDWEEEPTIPYGLRYPLEPSAAVLRFVEAIRDAVRPDGEEQDIALFFFTGA